MKLNFNKIHDVKTQRTKLFHLKLFNITNPASSGDHKNIALSKIKKCMTIANIT
jgi:hypothetical protein